MPDDKKPIQSPQIDGFKTKGKLTGSLKQLADILRSITFLEVAQERDAIEAAYIEKRDINKSPYLFSILKINENELEIVYSIPPGIAPRKRRIDIVMYLLNILSVIETVYKVDNKLMYQLLEDSIKKFSESISPEYAKLYTAYDTIKKEADDLRKRVVRLSEENKGLITRNFELKNKYDEIKVQSSGETGGMNNEALKARVQEWIIEHHGEINVYEFSKTHKVTEGRVEEALNQLVNEGYLEVLK